MALITRRFITRNMLQAAPDTLFAFGDNIARMGFGGQAREMRGEPNAVGIPTKWIPSNEPVSFFHDIHLVAVRPFIDSAFHILELHLGRGGDVVWPEDGIGTGLADLPRRAPNIYELIQQNRAALVRS